MRKNDALDAKNQGPDLVKNDLAGDVLQFKRFGGLRSLTNMDAHMVPNSHQNRAIGRPWSIFFGFCEVLEGCVF